MPHTSKSRDKSWVQRNRTGVRRRARAHPVMVTGLRPHASAQNPSPIYPPMAPLLSPMPARLAHRAPRSPSTDATEEPYAATHLELPHHPTVPALDVSTAIMTAAA